MAAAHGTLASRLGVTLKVIACYYPILQCSFYSHYHSYSYATDLFFEYHFVKDPRAYHYCSQHIDYYDKYNDRGSFSW